jgi:SAM-dependent methyltransferase
MSKSPSLIELGKAIQAKTGHYSGGPIQSFETAGRETLMALLVHGLLPTHRVLDFGCGSLRLGYWLIRFLDPDCYFGIEPVKKGVDAGLELAIGKELADFKRPRFSFNADSNMGVFKLPFDYVVARSILTHTAPAMLATVLNSFRETCPDGVMLASYWRADGPVIHDPQNVKGIVAVGDELPPDDARFIAVVRYTYAYMQRAAAAAGLSVVELDRRPINKQIWLKFTPLNSKVKAEAE